jgi:signal transduction histidine kinase
MTSKLTDQKSSEHAPSSEKVQAPATHHLPPFILLKEIPPEALFPSAVLTLIQKLSCTAIPLLVAGEPGLGQSSLSRVLHETGFTAGGPFLEMYLGPEKPENHLEILYQLLQTADSGAPFRGTLHIHGIENSSYLLQTFLLLMIEQGTLRFPDGRQRCFEGRVAVSMFKPFEQVVEQNCLVPPLVYCLTTSPVLLQPLRERSAVIPQLVDILVRAYEKQLMISGITVTPEASRRLQQYPWPGNVSELESVLYRSLLFCSSSSLDAKDILFSINPSSALSAEEPEAFFPQQDARAAQQATTGSALELSIAHLVAELSHEIKNPLVAIKTFIQLLPGHINDPEFLSDFFSVAAKSIDRIDYLTERMLEFAKLSQPHPVDIQLVSILQEAIKQNDSLSPPLQIQWHPDKFAKMPSLFADQEQLRYALENVLFHIAHTAPAGSLVELSANATPATMFLSISYAGERSAQGLAFSTAQGALIDDLNGLDLFLAQQVLQKNSIRCTKYTNQNATTITIQFPLPENLIRR